MKIIGAVTLWEHYALDNSKHSDNRFLLPDNGVFFHCSLIIRPDIMWPGNQRMANYAKEKINTLLRIGGFTNEVLMALDQLWDSEFVDCLIRFDTLEKGETFFANAREGGVVDIYLYNNGKLYQKYD